MIHPEDERSESKQSLAETKAIVESVAAFATATGGTVRIGIHADGRRTGVQLGRNTLENLANDIKRNTDPPQFPSIVMEGPEDAAVLRVTVAESPIKPVWAYDRPFRRVGRTNQRLSPEETRRLMEITTGRTWDSLPCAGFRVQDVDRRALRDFLERADQDPRTETPVALENLKMITPEGVSNAAVLLFSAEPQRFFLSSQVKCGRFLGVTTVHFLDEQTLDGSVLTQLDQALAFVARNTTQGIVITGRPEREIVPEYPAAAVREAVVNAICHRDYTHSGTVQIRIFDDRLEVWNPGTLPPGLTVEGLYRQHSSQPRNRQLAMALYRARLIEQWGTGTIRIVEACEARGMPRPEFITEMGFFIVRFRKAAGHAQVSGKAGREERYRKALAFAGEHGRITWSQYRDLFHLSRAQATRDLSNLVEQGKLVREGKGAASHYLLPDPA